MREGLLVYPSQALRGVCHARLYSDGVRAVALIGELSDNPGPSVTNTWDVLAPVIYAHLALDHPAWSDIEAASVTFVEHYPAEADRPEGTFDLVTLTPGGNPRRPWSAPRWSPSSRGHVENLLLGQPVQVWKARNYLASAFPALG